LRTRRTRQKPAGYAKRFLRAIVESERKKVHKTLGLEPVDAMKSTMSAFEELYPSNEEAAGDTPAGYGKRALGAIIDFLTVAVVATVPTVVFFIGAGAARNASDKDEPITTAAGMMMILGSVGGLVVFVWAIWLFGHRQGVTGTTPGKRAAGPALTAFSPAIHPVAASVTPGSSCRGSSAPLQLACSGSSTTCGPSGTTTTND
jgi:hypothetical protein